MADITSILSKFNIPKIGVTDIIEMLIIAFMLYRVLVWMKKTRAWYLLKGVAVVLIFFGIAYIFDFHTILYIGQRFISWIIIAFIVVFQPEIRHALENLGQKNRVFNVFSPHNTDSGFDERTIDELVTASFKLSATRTGALIVIEKEMPLAEYSHTGIAVDALLTSQLLINIFEHNTPLHDGAVIVKGNRVEAATCYLPLSRNLDISKTLGTRHRAALGVSEQTDSMTIIVSEETGQVSVATGGQLELNLNRDRLRTLLDRLRDSEAAGKKGIFGKGGWWFGRKKDR